MDEITQIEEALKKAGLPGEAAIVHDVIRRQYQRRGYTPWDPGQPLPIVTMAMLIRNWVKVFDIPVWYREWPQDGYRLLVGALKLEVRSA